MSDFRTDSNDPVGDPLAGAGEPVTPPPTSAYRRAADTARSAASDAASKARQEAATLKDQATDRARAYAIDGKTRASGALDGIAELLEDAARQIDEKLGAQYGGYARTAAGQVQGLATTLRDRDVDDLVADARDFVRQSPGVAIGAAAAIGFVLARLVKSGLDETKTFGTPPNDRRGGGR